VAATGRSYSVLNSKTQGRTCRCGTGLGGTLDLTKGVRGHHISVRWILILREPQVGLCPYELPDIRTSAVSRFLVHD